MKTEQEKYETFMEFCRGFYAIAGRMPEVGRDFEDAASAGIEEKSDEAAFAYGLTRAKMTLEA